MKKWLTRIFIYCTLMIIVYSSVIINTPPPLNGNSGSTFPESSDVPRGLDFSGYSWDVRNNAETRGGPGPNYFGGGEDQVWVDPSGYLHLTITLVEDHWECTEVYTEETFGYGTYVFSVAPGMVELDPMMILGLFTYFNDTQEIDFELAQWGNPEANNAQFALQPAHIEGNLERFTFPPSEKGSIHVFTWCSEYVIFQSFIGDSVAVISAEFGKYSNHSALIHQWAYTGEDIPLERNERVHMNLWLMSGGEPLAGQPAEITIREFSFIPSDCEISSLEGFDLSNGFQIAGFPFLILGLISVLSVISLGRVNIIGLWEKWDK